VHDELHFPQLVLHNQGVRFRIRTSSLLPLTWPLLIISAFGLIYVIWQARSYILTSTRDVSFKIYTGGEGRLS